MEEFYLSCKLYDWASTSNENIENILQEAKKNRELNKNCIIDVWPIGTQEAVARATLDYPGKKICWLNLANAHNTCGTYSVAFGGSQEEEVATNCNAAAILGFHAEKHTKGVRPFMQKGEPHIGYRVGKHIPPAGNYFCRTKFITSSPHIECSMIAAAFADFRPYIPFFTPYSERKYFFNWFGYGSCVTQKEEYQRRLRLDIEGVFLTAIKEGIDVLILGAGGCGAFQHTASVDAKIWKEVLDQYLSFFDASIFAILPDKRRPENVTAFENEFTQQAK
jgi:hypothetical protein